MTFELNFCCYHNFIVLIVVHSVITCHFRLYHIMNKLQTSIEGKNPTGRFIVVSLHFVSVHLGQTLHTCTMRY